MLKISSDTGSDEVYDDVCSSAARVSGWILRLNVQPEQVTVRMVVNEMQSHISHA